MQSASEIVTDDRLNGADIVPLTMALVQMSGDLTWLDRIAPHVRGPWDYSERLPDELKAEIRDAAGRELRRVAAGGEVRLASPDEETIRRMMSVAVAETVPQEYVAMALEQMGWEQAVALATPERVAEKPAITGFSVAIIGAGASGICAAIKLREAGVAYTIFEKNDEVGGTWYENRYPGCQVDTPNHFYQFSFAPNDDWPNYYSRQPSILDYLKNCADRFGIRERIRFRNEVRGARYCPETRMWRVTAVDQDGRVHEQEFNALICAVGQLNRPAIPDIPGLDDFPGPVMHTASWRDDVDLTGRKVALIGTGASAVQVGPGIVDQVARLTVYQRSGAWVSRSPNVLREVSEGKKWALKTIPFYAPWYRFQLFWGFGDGLFQALAMDPAYDGNDLAVNALNQRFRETMLRHMHRELEGRPDLIAKATPDYPPFGKRVLADAGWYKMLRRDNVELVTTGIERIEPGAIVLKDGRSIETDAIVLATGFHAGRMLWPMDIVGRSGRSIREIWGDNNPRAYLGIAVPDFPNMFVMYGPNTNLGHGGSAIFLAECQTRYIVKMIGAMIAAGISEAEIRQDVHDAYNEDIDRRLKRLVWSHPKVSTWYKNGEGRIITNQPWRLVDYWRLTHEPNLAEYKTA